MFLWNSLAFSMIQRMLAIWSLVPLKPAWTSGSSHEPWTCWTPSLLKPGLENFKHYFTSVWNECNCAVLEHSLALPFFGIGMKTNLFQSCGHCWVFKICWHIEFSGIHIEFILAFTASSFRIWSSSDGIPSPSLALLIVMLPKASLWCYSHFHNIDFFNPRTRYISPSVCVILVSFISVW